MVHEYSIALMHSDYSQFHPFGARIYVRLPPDQNRT